MKIAVVITETIVKRVEVDLPEACASPRGIRSAVEELTANHFRELERSHVVEVLVNNPDAAADEDAWDDITFNVQPNMHNL